MKPSQLLATAGLVVVAAGIGFALQRLVLPRTQPPLTPVAATPGTPADDAPAPEALAPRRVPLPETLPQFEMEDRDGKLRRLGEWQGRPLIVNYWATWCPPCVREIPLLEQLRRDHAAMRVEVIGIAVDFRDDVLAFARERGLSYPLLIGEETGLAAVDAVGMEPTFPFSLFADSQQRIVTLKVGELHRDEADLILQRVAQVDAGTLPLEEARAQIAAGLKTLAARRAGATGTP